MTGVIVAMFLVRFFPDTKQFSASYYASFFFLFHPSPLLLLAWVSQGGSSGAFCHLLYRPFPLMLQLLQLQRQLVYPLDSVQVSLLQLFA